MTTFQKARNAMMLGALAAVLAAPALASPAMQPVQEGNITYISGGIGDDEREQLHAGASEYNLKIINSDPTGHYTADTNLTIQSKDGRQMISAADTGPLFYAKLPAGRYTIDAVNHGQHHIQDVNVSSGKTQSIKMIWRDQNNQL